MEILSLFRRLFFLPIGLMKGLMEIANDKARDIENITRYPKSVIDKNCSFTSDTRIGINSRFKKGATVNHSVIGSYSYFGENALIQHTTIGNYCSISRNVTLGLGAHPLDRFSTSPLFYKPNNPLRVKLVTESKFSDEYKRILIGNDVWIGANAIIMDGVSVGNGAVIAAGAVVTKDVPHFAIVGGIPAKVIKYRFPEEASNTLVETLWWDKKPQEIKMKIEELNILCKGDNNT